MTKHISVLLKESLTALNIQEDGIYVDATLGYGGHSGEILKRIPKGFLYAFDQDKEAINYSSKYLSSISSNFLIINNNFVNLKEELEKINVKEVDGFLFDIGVSSPQLDEKERGFSYHEDARLDMRMNREQKLSAYEVVNNYSYEKLVDILYRYGEEKYAKNIAKNIIKKREEKNIETTLELVDIIKNSMPEKAKRDKHPARRTFQAIRIEVNNELEVLDKALEEAISMLKVNGVLAVITFHSLEDTLVKEKFKKYTDIDKNLNNLPYIPENLQPKYKLGKKITPSRYELENNNRARSATLRTIIKIKE